VKKSKGRNQKHKKLSTAKRKTNKQILPALAAVGGVCGLAATPASALELGEIRVDSALGQPLRASIAYALAPNEQMFDFCIFLKPGITANGMPVISNARVTITENAIVLNGRMPIKEPLLAMQLSVNCPYTAHLARDYTLMIDPPLPGEGERAVLSTERPPMTPVQTSTVTASDIPVAARPAPVQRRSTRRPQDETPIAARSRYLVQQGDSLSQIVARIEERTVPLWPAVNAIFAANPHAFLDNDPNLLKAGSWLDIPDLTDATAVTTLATSQPATEPVNRTPTAGAYPGAAIAATETAIEPEAPAEPAEPAEVAEPAEPVQAQAQPELLTQSAPPVETVEEPALIAEVAEEPAPAVEPIEAPTETTPQLRPGDFVIGTDNPFVVPVGSDDAVVDIPDSELRGPQVAQPVPSVAVTNEDEGGISGGWAWLLWLGGAGLAMILGLFLFGRQLREYFGAVPAGVPVVPQRRRDDAQPRPTTIADVDYNFDATTITGRKILLDADLEDGTGLQGSDELDVAQDFAFSATESEIDMEIPELPVEEEELPPTDVMPAQAGDEATILDSEVLPADKAEDDDEDDEDYSVSMNVDATKQILDDNTATTKDLQAIMVDTSADVSVEETGEYSLSRSAEYQILEQDYEDELTATQALNKEIEQAARALAEQMDDPEGKDKTKEMPASQDPDMTAELTANLEAPGDAQNEEFGDSGAIPDLMVEMPESDGDETLDVESPLIESEKKEASSG
jgi:hypothetical protein